MSRATIHIPLEHIQALRKSLEASRRDIERELHGGASGSGVRDIDMLLEQLAPAPVTAGRSVSGPREVLWRAAYDALCAGAESFAADCNDLWRGRLTVADARIALVRLGERLDLVDALAASPAAIDDGPPRVAP